MNSSIPPRIFLVLLVPVLFSISATAQSVYCLTDSLYGSHGRPGSPHHFVAQKPEDDDIRTIPVVVHVIHQNGPENISDEQVQSQIDVLNKDFRRHNADSVNTDSVFKPIAADMQIEFCLATLDPDGNATTGITHNEDETSSSSLLIKKYGWDNNKYLNIFITAKSGWNFSSYPWSPDSLDAIFVNHYRFGTIGTAGTDPNHLWSNLGRTCTHEVGHYLGLLHTFCGDCIRDCVIEYECDPICEWTCDSVCDTQPASLADRAFIGVCLPHGMHTCPSSDLPDQVDNYMDYNIDSCANMFSLGQKERAHYFLDVVRSNLTSDANHVATGCMTSIGINELTAGSDFSVFPNPNEGTFTISLNKEIPGEAEVSVVNVFGQQLYGERILVTNKHAITIRDLARGIYFVRIQNTNRVMSEKVIVE